MDIAVVGAGAIGSRHLQSLRGLQSPATVHIVDPSDTSLALARERWDEASPGSDHDLVALRDLKGLAEPLDLAIVATNSDVRREVIEQLLGQVPVAHLVLEKFLFPTPADYERVCALVGRKATTTWVNTARRMWPIYQQLRDSLDLDRPVSLSVTAPVSVGLGSNSVHFLDLLTFLTGRSIVALEGSLLKPIKNLRREGHVEFSGTIVGRNEFGDYFSLTTLAGTQTPHLIAITTGTQHVVINESDGLMSTATESSGWSWTSSEFVVPLQSQLTKDIAVQLVSQGTCSLPSLEEASTSHLALLDAFIDNYRIHVDGEATSCPVT